MSLPRFFVAAIVVFMVGSIGADIVDAAENQLARWTGLWCSGPDEIGIFARTDMGRHAEGESASLYLYVHHSISDSNSYTLQGFTSPDDERIELLDGNCRISAKLDDGNLFVTDNGPCDKISGVFRSRRFDRMRERIIFGSPWRTQFHCSGMKDRK